MKGSTEVRIVKICPYPPRNIRQETHEVDLRNNEGELIMKIQAGLLEKPVLKEGEILVIDPAQLFRIVLRQPLHPNEFWQAFVGLKILTLVVIQTVVEIVSDISSDISGINYQLEPDMRPGDEPPFEERRENGNNTGKI